MSSPSDESLTRFTVAGIPLITSELRTKREKVTTLFDTEGQFARKEFSLVAD